MKTSIVALRLSKTSQIILEEFSRVQDWALVKKNLKVTDAEIATAKRVAVTKILAAMGSR